MTDSPFNYHRANHFNKRAIRKGNLGSDLGFNLKDTSDAMDFANALLTEYADTADERGMARLAIASACLMGDPIEPLQQQIRGMIERGELTSKDRYVNNLTLSVASVASRSIRNASNLAGDTANASGKDINGEHRVESPDSKAVDISDPQDVVKYLFQVGAVSAGHARALLVQFGFHQPDETTQKLENELRRVTNDLEVRMDTLHYGGNEPLGARIIRQYLVKRQHDSKLQLTLENVDAMTAVGQELLALFRLKENQVAIKKPVEKDGKYEGTGVYIPLEEEQPEPAAAAPARRKVKETKEQPIKKRLVPLEYTAASVFDRDVSFDPEDEEHTIVTEMYAAAFGLDKRELKAGFHAYIDPSPRNREINPYQEGVIERITHSLASELGGTEEITRILDQEQKVIIKKLFGIQNGSSEEARKYMLYELIEADENGESIAKQAYEALRIIVLRLEVSRPTFRNLPQTNN